MRNVMTFLGALTIIFTLATGCSRDARRTDPWKKNDPIAPASAGGDFKPTQDVLAKEPLADLVGYWSSVDQKEVFRIDSRYEESEKRVVTRLVGFDVKPYSGIPTTFWGVHPFETVDRPEIVKKGDGTISAVLTNETVKNGEARTVEVVFEFNLSENKDSLIVNHGTPRGTRTIQIFKRIKDETEGEKRLLDLSRIRAREIVRYYADTAAENCRFDSTAYDSSYGMALNAEIYAQNLTCVRELVLGKNAKVTDRHVADAVSMMDYDIVALLVPRMEGATDVIIKELLARGPSTQIRQLKGGKPFSLELDFYPIFNLLLKKVGEGKAIKDDLKSVLAGLSYRPERDLIFADLLNIVGADVMREQLARGTYLIDAIHHFRGKPSERKYIELLVEAGAHVNAAYADQSSNVARAAVQFGDVELIRFLKSKGTDFAVVDRNVLTTRRDALKLEMQIKTGWGEQRELLKELNRLSEIDLELYGKRS